MYVYNSPDESSLVWPAYTESLSSGRFKIKLALDRLNLKPFLSLVQVVSVDEVFPMTKSL